MSTDLQDRITAARREAEGLKEKIKRKKDELADADCGCPYHDPDPNLEGYYSQAIAVFGRRSWLSLAADGSEVFLTKNNGLIDNMIE